MKSLESLPCRQSTIDKLLSRNFHNDEVLKGDDQQVDSSIAVAVRMMRRGKSSEV